MHLVLNEEVYQRYKCTEEKTSHNLAIFHGTAIVGTESETAHCPGQSRNKIRNHKYIMPVMIISRRDICPTSAHKRSKQPSSRNELGEVRARTRSEKVPKKNESKSRTGSDCDENLEEGSFGIPIANRRRHRGEPFVRVAIMLVLHDLPEMQAHAYHQGAEKCSIREGRMGPRHPFPVDLPMR